MHKTCWGVGGFERNDIWRDNRQLAAINCLLSRHISFFTVFFVVSAWCLGFHLVLFEVIQHPSVAELLFLMGSYPPKDL